MPLQSSACCELYSTLVTVVRAGLHMVTLNVAKCLAFVTEAFVTEATTPELGSIIVHLVDRLFLDVSKHFVLIHKDFVTVSALLHSALALSVVLVPLALPVMVIGGLEGLAVRFLGRGRGCLGGGLPRLRLDRHHLWDVVFLHVLEGGGVDGGRAPVAHISNNGFKQHSL